MKTSNPYYRSLASRCEGSVLLFGLVIMGLATFGLAAWMSLMTTRSYMIETAEYAIQRRVAYHNGAAVAEEHLYRNAITGNAVPEIHVELPDYMGAVDIDPHSGAALTATNFAGSINRFSPSEGSSYTLDVVTAISDGAETTTRVFQMKSRNPMLAGDLLTLHAPSINTGDRRLEGNLWIEGRSHIWIPDGLQDYDYGDVRSESYITPTEGATSFNVVDLTGTNLIPNNFPSVPMTAGPTATGLGYDGTAQTVNYSGNAGNSIYEKIITRAPVIKNGLSGGTQQGVSSNGSGRINIDLDEPSLNYVVINSNTDRIVFDGQDNPTDFAAAGSLDPVVVVYQILPGSVNIGRIEFNHANNRQLLLAIKSAPGAPDSGVNFRFDHANQDPIWRLFTVSENFRITMRSNTDDGTVTLIGGIRADRRITVDESDFYVRVRKEPNPKPMLELLSDRNAWIESFSDGAYTAGTDPFEGYNRPPGTIAWNDPTEHEPPGGSSGSSGGGGPGGGGDPDTTPPTVTLSASSNPANGPFTVIVSFSEPVSGVESSDFLVTNGVLSSLTGSGPNYIFSVTPISLGPITIDLPAGRAADAALNGNIAAGTLNVSFEGPVVMEYAAFDSDLDGWTFVADPFKGTSAPSQEFITYEPVGQFDGGGVELEVGGVDNADYFGLSAAISKMFFFDVDSTAELSFDYRMFMPEEYETGEDGELIVAVDGNIVMIGSNDFVDTIINCCGNGGGDQEIISSATIDLGTLSAGLHTIEIGIYNNKKTFNDEYLELDLDNIKLEVSLP